MQGLQLMPAADDDQAEFARALLDPARPAPLPVRRGSGNRFDVHRNNVVASLIEALRSSYPATHRLVGDQYFRVVARAYVHRYPPRSPVLLRYGRSFGPFIESLPTTADFPYLGDVAGLEWARVRAMHAREAEPIGIEMLASVPECRQDAVTLVLHPSVRLIRSRWPVVSLWQATREGESRADREIDMRRAEQALVVRPSLDVGVHILTVGGDAFVAALRRGRTLLDAAQQAADATERFDLAAQLAQLFDCGAIVGIRSRSRDAEDS